MATVSYKVCDRCNKEIRNNSYLKSILSIKRKITFIKYFGGSGSEWKYELCGVCTDKLDDFLANESDTGEGKA